MIYTLPKRDPELAYLDTWLWLPKKLISVDVIKHSLVIPVQLQEGTSYVYLWRESKHHLGVPRERLASDELQCDLVDLTPRSYQETGITSNVTLDAVMPEKNTQELAFGDLMDATSGILNMKCGGGKTVIMLHAIAHWGVPAIVINDKNHILRQWKAEANQFLEVPGGIGWVQGKPETWDWEKGLVFASLKTLAIYRDQVPPKMRCHYGVAIWDEIHHLSATDYSKTADLFYGRRYGATATVNRPDGSELLYLWHVGDVLHRNLKQDVIPTVIFKENRKSRVEWHNRDIRRAVTDKTGEINIKRLCAYVGQLDEEIEFLRPIIEGGIERKRDVMAVSVSKDQVIRLGEEFPAAGVLHGGVKEAERLGILRNHKLVFATVDLAKEALNKRSLDTLIVLTEFSSKNMLQQAMGRIQRYLEGKPQTKVIVVYHVNVDAMKGMGKKMMRHFRKWGIKVKVMR